MKKLAHDPDYFWSKLIIRPLIAIITLFIMVLLLNINLYHRTSFNFNVIVKSLQDYIEFSVDGLFALFFVFGIVIVLPYITISSIVHTLNNRGLSVSYFYDPPDKFLVREYRNAKLIDEKITEIPTNAVVKIILEKSMIYQYTIHLLNNENRTEELNSNTPLYKGSNGVLMKMFVNTIQEYRPDVTIEYEDSKSIPKIDFRDHSNST